MKKIIYFLAISFALLVLHACQKEFLQVPLTTGNVDLEKVFSTKLNAEAALFSGYRRALGYGNNGEYNLQYGTLGSVGGERGRGWSWHPTYAISNGGTTSNLTVLNYNNIYTIVRSQWIVNENIDKVPDMDAALKATVKGETKGLIAYMYMYGLKAYGGIPLVKRALSASDDLSAPRASVDETVKYIVELCDEATAALPSTWPAAQKGRLTKSAVMAIKAQTLMFAARPLFNSSTPYLSLGANNNLISYGAYSEQRWLDAIAATNAALTEAKANGNDIINTGGGTNAPNANALADYGTATSTPGNREVILAHQNQDMEAARFRNLSGFWTDTKFNNQRGGLLGNFLSNYQKADGTEQNWPKIGDAAPRVATDYITRFGQMEPRFRADFAGPGIQAANNPNDSRWGFNTPGWGVHTSNYGTANNFPNASDYGQGVAWPTKFFYMAGGRLWYEFPVFRAAELYLNLAEAYNEAGQTALALSNLNIVHNRAGLPSIVETDKVRLRAAIQREWAVEFYDENKRYFDVKHWRLPAIGNGIIGGDIIEFQFQMTSASNKSLPSTMINYYMAKTYTAYWNDKMHLEPFPQAEVNKNAVIQNPGY
ncbi:RagB/SusD family nutrient uptake outer membrane protein [Pedobacter jejuensis]|uniref:RagB/SusD family nutrient uptake outer membrane protein n=1 Tax=Pedobacter jejuensis TaxID=1268550 RepID=A0A3N0C114_9SPHI|nr:RagB/SusD family nutrient uptake outer membrane protein [Pedobacter jejuensis]RNL55887.1 RagB/SusD family nutrient uptake outer membrane protein [Pedobacter jejuensis]